MCEDKRKIIAYLWYLNAILSIAYVITAIAVAQRNNVAETGNKAAGFAAIWSMFILFLIVIGGTFTMKRVSQRPCPFRVRLTHHLQGFRGLTSAFTCFFSDYSSRRPLRRASSSARRSCTRRCS